MLNTDFDPYNAIAELQQIQHLQAENLVKVSEWMMEISRAGTNQVMQANGLLKMIENLNSQLQLLDQRIVLLEKHLQSSINNTSSETLPTWDI